MAPPKPPIRRAPPKKSAAVIVRPASALRPSATGPKIKPRRGKLASEDSESDDDDWDDEDEGDEDDTGPSAKSGRPGRVKELKPQKIENVLKAFDAIWTLLFSSPVHLDSALSKQARNMKTILAQIVPVILLRPASTAEALGVGVPEGEPWNLTPPQLVAWRPARMMAERLYSLMAQGHAPPIAIPEDFPPGFLEECRRQTAQGGNFLPLIRELGNTAPLSLRAARKPGPREVLKGLRASSQLPVKAELSDLVPTGVRLAGYAPILNTELYEQGAFEIQDEGSQLMALFALWPESYQSLLSQAPGPVKTRAAAVALPKDVPAWTVVDACAGAGGKSLALADALAGKGRVYAYDTGEKKILALRRRARRAGLNNIQAIALEEGKESDVISRFRRRAQVVLVDAPCSGWGVVRRNPDIKWRQTPDTLVKMPEIQMRLLSAYSELVAPGGRLVFGVCTFRQAETTDIVKWFLERHPTFTAEAGGYLGPGPTDGFFMQAFKRSG